MRWTRNRLREIADKHGIIKRGNSTIRIFDNGDILRWEKKIPLKYLKKMSVSDAVKVLDLTQVAKEGAYLEMQND